MLLALGCGATYVRIALYEHTFVVLQLAGVRRLRRAAAGRGALAGREPVARQLVGVLLTWRFDGARMGGPPCGRAPLLEVLGVALRVNEDQQRRGVRQGQRRRLARRQPLVAVHVGLWRAGRSCAAACVVRRHARAHLEPSVAVRRDGVRRERTRVSDSAHGGGDLGLASRALMASACTVAPAEIPAVAHGLAAVLALRVRVARQQVGAARGRIVPRARCDAVAASAWVCAIIAACVTLGTDCVRRAVHQLTAVAGPAGVACA
mmetsp:Transcript_113636/g.275978  ORF Transcript_113636/g.275978 Transcript_113636/m.275978 type:complete len:263 (+) Transcript_113636:158-946(+)